MIEFLSFLTGYEVTAICVVTMVILMTMFSRRSPGMPPGPTSYPLIGCIGQINPRKLDQDLTKFRGKYGDVFSLMFFNRPIVFINGYENAREIFLSMGEISSERPSLIFTKILAKGMGIVANSGKPWKEQRTFALTTLRSFGFGKRSIENQVLAEIDVFLDNVDKTREKPFDIYEKLSLSISNVICSIALGQQYDHDDKNFLKLLRILRDFFKIGATLNAGTIFPALRFVPGDLFGIKKLTQNFEEVVSFLREIVEEHRKTFDGNETRDYIDAYLLAQRQRSHDPESTFTNEQLIQTVRDLFIAGTETTTTTLRWAVLYLILNPRVQDKMREEIDKEIGSARLPSLNDKPKLPYCEAVITEVQRCSNIIPTNVAHTMTQDTNFKGYLIPKGAIILTNMNSILKDPATFPKPESFNPDRFIDADGKFILSEKVMPFGIGRRICLGESLARTELFLFLTSLVQKFELRAESDNSAPTLNEVFGITRSPSDYKIRAIRRK